MYELSPGDTSHDEAAEYFGRTLKKGNWQSLVRQSSFPLRVTNLFGFSMKYVALALVCLCRSSPYHPAITDPPTACTPELNPYSGT